MKTPYYCRFEDFPGYVYVTKYFVIDTDEPPGVPFNPNIVYDIGDTLVKFAKIGDMEFLICAKCGHRWNVTPPISEKQLDLQYDRACRHVEKVHRAFVWDIHCGEIYGGFPRYRGKEV